MVWNGEVDFESTSSANSNTPADFLAYNIIAWSYEKIKYFLKKSLIRLKLNNFII